MPGRFAEQSANHLKEDLVDSMELNWEKFSYNVCRIGYSRKRCFVPPSVGNTGSGGCAKEYELDVPGIGDSAS